MECPKPNHKFRGRSVDTGEYVYGSLLRLPNDCYIIENITWDEYNSSDKDRTVIFVDNSTDTTYQSPLKMDKVEKDSIAQLIGYDKDFKEVYEDDTLIDLLHFGKDRPCIFAVEALKRYRFCDIFGSYILFEGVKENDN